MKTFPGKFILSSEGIDWFLISTSGKIEGYVPSCFFPGTGVMYDSPPKYEFWVSNPPSEHLDLFKAVCEFAVAKELLRQIPIYTVVNK